MKREARAFLAIYLGGAPRRPCDGRAWVLYLHSSRAWWAASSMQLFTIIQHAELAEDQHDLTKSTRSFATNWFARFLYANMARPHGASPLSHGALPRPAAPQRSARGPACRRRAAGSSAPTPRCSWRCCAAASAARRWPAEAGMVTAASDATRECDHERRVASGLRGRGDRRGRRGPLRSRRRHLRGLQHTERGFYATDGHCTHEAALEPTAW